MALPLAFAIAAAPAKADLARGEAEFLRGNAHCDAREFSDALASYDRAAAFGYEDHVMWNNRGVALDGLGPRCRSTRPSSARIPGTRSPGRGRGSSWRS